MITQKKLLILGFGGHARSVADVALTCGYEDLIFVDDSASPGENFLGYPVVNDMSRVDGSWNLAFPAAGDSLKRFWQCHMIDELGMALVSLISPMATIGRESIISQGCFVGHHVHIGPLTRIGRACIINTGAVVEHEAYIGNFSHVSINSTVAGRSTLGSFCMLGAGGTIIDGISTVDGVIIGAGALVIRSIQHSGTYMGVPARQLK